MELFLKNIISSGIKELTYTENDLENIISKINNIEDTSEFLMTYIMDSLNTCENEIKLHINIFFLIEKLMPNTMLKLIYSMKGLWKTLPCCLLNNSMKSIITDNNIEKSDIFFEILMFLKTKFHYAETIYVIDDIKFPCFKNDNLNDKILDEVFKSNFKESKVEFKVESKVKSKVESKEMQLQMNVLFTEKEYFILKSLSKNKHIFRKLFRSRMMSLNTKKMEIIFNFLSDFCKKDFPNLSLPDAIFTDCLFLSDDFHYCIIRENIFEVYDCKSKFMYSFQQNIDFKNAFKYCYNCSPSAMCMSLSYTDHSKLIFKNSEIQTSTIIDDVSVVDDYIVVLSHKEDGFQTISIYTEKLILVDEQSTGYVGHVLSCVDFMNDIYISIRVKDPTIKNNDYLFRKFVKNYKCLNPVEKKIVEDLKKVYLRTKNYYYYFHKTKNNHKKLKLIFLHTNTNHSK